MTTNEHNVGCRSRRRAAYLARLRREAVAAAKARAVAAAKAKTIHVDLFDIGDTIGDTDFTMSKKKTTGPTISRRQLAEDARCRRDDIARAARIAAMTPDERAEARAVARAEAHEARVDAARSAR